MSEQIPDIQENPLDSVEVMTGIMEESKADEEPAVEINYVLAMEITEKNKPKAKGRPKGSLNKGPSKPRAKKTQIQETPVEETPVYEPSSPKRNLKMPADPSSSDIAAAMLKLLQDQTYSRQARKQRLYQSWFQ